VNRQQMSWRAVDVEHLIGEDHPARAIWALVGRLNLSAFYQAKIGLDKVSSTCDAPKTQSGLIRWKELDASTRCRLWGDGRTARLD
jgi:hypothetical protein